MSNRHPHKLLGAKSLVPAFLVRWAQYRPHLPIKVLSTFQDPQLLGHFITVSQLHHSPSCAPWLYVGLLAACASIYYRGV